MCTFVSPPYCGRACVLSLPWNGGGGFCADAPFRQCLAPYLAAQRVGRTVGLTAGCGSAAAERRQALAQIERQASTANQHVLYALGSLYHLGQPGSDALVQQDLARASLYLGNAAIRGSILAMAKMAEIQLAQRQYRQAMIWAQVFAHYALLLPKSERSHDGYAAELVQRIMQKLGHSGIPDVMPDVAAFIASHDAQIRAGDDNIGARTPHTGSRSRPFLTPAYRFQPRSGVADYLIAFKPDGSMAHVWLVDAVPDAALGKALRSYAEESTLKAAPPGSQAMRYSWLPVMFDDGRYRVSSARESR